MLSSVLKIPSRWRFQLGFLACTGGMAFALYLEHFRHLDPCALCVLQRVAMIATGVVFLIAALHGAREWGRYIYGVLVAMAALVGVGIAGRHVWLQSLPPDQVPACGPPLDHLMKIMPWSDALTFVLKGEGNCAIIAGQWLGISLPGWTLVGFVLLVLWAVYCALPVHRDTI
ncbi:MAG: disulfide bond formation protein B [Nevskiales bacterium]